MLLRYLLPVLVPFASLLAQGRHVGHGGDLGVVDFRPGCAPAVEAEFNRGVALLHHMMYEGAREAFRNVVKRDSSCAMAHWGVAMTLFHPLWNRPPVKALRDGHEAVRRAMALGPRTGRDSMLVAATAAFYESPERDEWWPRLTRWAAAMDRAHAARPDDRETAAFYALSQLAAGVQAPDRMAYHARAARVLLAIVEDEPRHPGAIHYTIHANDVTGRADSSLAVVRSYDEVAPDVPHALHMPTHIFVRLGEWPEVIEWNRKSADAALRYPAEDRISLHHIHALDYLLYAYLQRGDDAAAGRVLEEALGREKYQDDFASAYHLAAMPARHALERRDWKAAAAITPRTPAYLGWDRYPWAEAIAWLARGVGAARTGNIAVAEEAQARMQALRDGALAAGEKNYATYIDIDRLIVASAIAAARGDTAAAIARLTEAADAEGTVQKHPVTPGAVIPPREALGDLLLAAGRPREALAAYEASLGVWPGRFNGLLGAARAAREAGDTAAAKRWYGVLLETVRGSQATRPGVDEAKRAIAAR